MDSKGSYFSYYGRGVILGLVLIVILAILYAIFGPRSAYPLKTTEIELRDVGGEYDDKIKIYRDPDNTIVILTDQATVKIKDGTITLSGNIRIESGEIGTTALPKYLHLKDGELIIPVETLFYSSVHIGTMQSPQTLRFLNSLGEVSIHLLGDAGSAALLGGLNLGTATGASPGCINMSGVINSTGTGTGSSGNKFSGDVSVSKGLNLGTSSGAGTGQIKASGKIETPNSNVLGKTLQLKAQTAIMPTASAAYRGQFYLKACPIADEQDFLYVCLRDIQAGGYRWILVAEGWPY